MLLLSTICFGSILFEVRALDFTISDHKVLEGSSGKLTMVCDILETDVEYVLTIQISRIKSTSLSKADLNNWDILAKMQLGQIQKPSLSQNINASDKDYVAGGSWDSTTPANTYLTLSMNLNKLTCDDGRYYKCNLIYKSTTSGTVVSTDSISNFAVYVKPQVTSLIVRKNGILVQGSRSTKPIPCHIGDELELKCTANIGSLPETLIRWRRTSQDSSNDQFIDYEPESGTNDNGTSVSDSHCGFTRIATVKYYIKLSDTNADIEQNLGFECYVSISGDIYGYSFTTKNNPRIFADVSELTTVTNSVTKPNDYTDLPLSGMVGAVVVSLIVGIIGGIICTSIFLFRRRKLKGLLKQEQHIYMNSREAVINEIPSTLNTYEQLKDRAERDNKRAYDTLKDGTDNKALSKTHYESLQQGANQMSYYETLNVRTAGIKKCSNFHNSGQHYKI